MNWRRYWARGIPFFDYPTEIRKVIYTPNAIESINLSLRKVIKTRSSFPTGTEKYQQEVDNANLGLESRSEAFLHPA